MENFNTIYKNAYEDIYELIPQESYNDLYPPLPKKLLNCEVIPVRDSKTNPKYNRNEICPCGSGLKYKKCCGNV